MDCITAKHTQHPMSSSSSSSSSQLLLLRQIVLTAYLHPLLTKHKAVDQFITHNDLTTSWQAALAALSQAKQKDQQKEHVPTVQKEITSMHQGQLKAYKDAAKLALLEWAENVVLPTVPTVTPTTTAAAATTSTSTTIIALDEYQRLCRTMAEGTLPNWNVTKPLLQTSYQRVEERATEQYYQYQKEQQKIELNVVIKEKKEEEELTTTTTTTPTIQSTHLTKDVIMEGEEEGGVEDDNKEEEENDNDDDNEEDDELGDSVIAEEEEMEEGEEVEGEEKIKSTTCDDGKSDEDGEIDESNTDNTNTNSKTKTKNIKSKMVKGGTMTKKNIQGKGKQIPQRKNVPMKAVANRGRRVGRSRGGGRAGNNVTK